MSNNSQYGQTQEVTQGEAVALPANPTSCSDTYTNFVGWFTAAAGSESSPSATLPVTKVTASTVPTGDATYYAVFSDGAGGGSGNWELVTDAGTLKAGDVLVIASNSNEATAGNIPADYMASIASTFSNNQSSITTLGDGTVELTLGGTLGAWTLANSSGNLLGATAVKKLAWGSGTTTWSITISDNDATIQNGTSTYGRFLYNVGSTRFTTYTSNVSASMLLPQLYRKTGGTPATGYISSCCNDAAVVTVTPTAPTINVPESGPATTAVTCAKEGGGNGGEWTYSVLPDDVGATFNGTTFTATQAGTYTITATYTENCAKSGSATITVKATPTITLVADEPITLTADCGQKATATVQVTAYNCGTNAVEITSSNTRITVSPASFTPADGKVKGEITLSYTATQGSGVDNQNAEISAKCGTTDGKNTISVTATKGNCTPSVLTFMDRGSQYKQINSHYAGQTLQASEVPDPKGVCTQPVEYIFDGWATAKVDNGVTSYEKVGFPYEIVGDQTFYAVYKYTEGGVAVVDTYDWETTETGNWTVDDAITRTDGQGVDGGYAGQISTANTYVTYKNKVPVTSFSFDFKRTTKNTNYNVYIETSTDNTNWTAAATYDMSSFSNGSYGTTTTHTFDGKTELYVRFHCYNTTATRYVDNVSISYGGGTTYYTSSPTCGPYVQIVGSKDIYVTSGNVGGRSTVQAQDTIRFTSGSLAGSGANAPKIKVPAADITINGTPTSVVEVTFVDNICTKNDGDGTYSITGGIVVKYKPTNSNATENIKVKLRAEYNTGKNVVLDSFMVHARSLPEKFVITAKGTDGKWYALPADMSGSSTQPANGQLVVDNTASPTKATITPCNTIYKFDGQKQGGDLRYVRFVGLGGKYLWAATTGNTGIKNDAKDPAAADAPYNWLLTSADNVTYTFANQNTDRTLRLSGTKFGMYDAKNGVNELRILPIVEKDTCAYNAAPQNISLLSRTSTTLTLAWSAVPGAERYQFSRNGGTDWYPCNGITDMEHPQYEFTKLSAATEYTIVLRAVHGNAAKICSDTAQITVTTANCDNPPTIGGTIADNSSCGTLTLTATGVTASTDDATYCPITQYGFQYTQDNTWATYEQTEHIDVPGSEFSNEVTVSRGGKYYVRLYAVNEVGTGYSTEQEITVSGLANLQIITAGDATTAPMISGKATLRIGAVSDSPSPITWQVFDGSNAEQTTIAAGIANNGVFSTTAFGVYRVVAKQAANADPTYCADSATIYIEVRLPNHYGYVTNCAVLNNNNLEVINVSKDNITFGIDDADVVQIEIVKENTGNTSTGGGGQAKDLFFSKYFEANGTAKMLAVFNGTANKISLSDISIVNPGSQSSKSLAEFGHIETGYIMPSEELIFYDRNGTATDTCMEKEATFPTWYDCSDQQFLSFGGPASIYLKRGNTIIDLIGATNIREINYPTDVTGTTFAMGTVEPKWGDKPGFTDESCGDNIKTEEVETNYGLSTNRCLLVRKNTVTDGSNAVEKNADGIFATLCEEWKGFQIDQHVNKGIPATCEGMAYVGSFDYAEYFNRYEPVTGKIDLVDLVDNGDGSWSLPTSSFEGTAWDGKNFHDLACTSVKINGYQKIGLKDSLITALNYKVPIIVDRTTTTDDAELFGFEGDGRIICPECDVVIRDNEKLSVVPAGYNNIRNMWVYSGAALNIQDDKTYNMGKLTIESENNEVGYALIKGTLNAQDGISHTKRIDANAWYDFSLPYNCKVSDIVRTNGKTLGLYSVNAGDLAKNDTARWVIKYYDGQKRAISGTPNGAAPTNWAVVPADGILEAGVGYIVALGGTHNANPNYKVRFVLPNRSTQPYVESVKDNRTKGVKGYTGPKAEELPCHKGWNYLGNPYVSRFDGDKQNPSWQTYTGLLLNGFYTDLLTGNSYDVIEYPDLYVAVDMGEGGATNWVQTKASLALLSPFRAFMIQAVSDGDVDFNKEARNLPQGQAPSVRSVNTERETISAVRLNIDHDTYGTGSTDIMLHSLYTDKYDLGYDMVRMFNSRPAAQPFTLNSTADYLLYNAANRDLAETSDIPVGIRTLAAGTYTFSLAPLTGTDRYAAIYLIDRDENDLKIDLLQGNYTTMLARETNTSRFALRFEKRAQLPTDIDNDAIQSPIIYRDQTDIVIDNLPTDATVRVVDAIGRTLYMQQADAQIVRFHAPARGAYIIQVMTQQGNFSIKTIL